MPYPSNVLYPGLTIFPGGQLVGYLGSPINTLTDYQVEFNGLLMGPGTPYDVPPRVELPGSCGVENDGSGACVG